MAPLNITVSSQKSQSKNRPQDNSPTNQYQQRDSGPKNEVQFSGADALRLPKLKDHLVSVNHSGPLIGVRNSTKLREGAGFGAEEADGTDTFNPTSNKTSLQNLRRRVSPTDSVVGHG